LQARKRYVWRLLQGERRRRRRVELGQALLEAVRINVVREMLIVDSGLTSVL
jgi:hypothetical protein